MRAKLNLDPAKVALARKHAGSVARHTQDFIDLHTTDTVERAICRLLGIDGSDSVGVPLPNIVVRHIAEKQLLPTGAALLVGNAMLKLGLSSQQIAEKICSGDLDICSLPIANISEIKAIVSATAAQTVEKIRRNRQTRSELLDKYGDKTEPYLYLIVASGNIYEDITQAVAAAKQGADVIAVIRSTGQSLLDYVPYGATTEGFGGTLATQENFRLMRRALDDAGAEVGRYIRLCNYCSGLCMPEIAAMGALERLDVML
ncbi:MAG: lysine 5,6-aminomutase subunit alpha, partial [Treponema sp.]|nr:lysine 5,6-aminomutase subunit alpha [Treponema sp.]